MRVKQRRVARNPVYEPGTRPGTYGGGHGRAMLTKFPWESIRQDYITGTMSREELTKKWGIAIRTLDQRIYGEGWPDLKAEYRKDAAKKLRDESLSSIIEKRKEGISLIYAIKIQVAKRLQERLLNPLYKPKVRDLEMLQRLEMDLRDPGWNKLPGDGTTVNVGIGIRVESVIEELRKRKVDALPALESPEPIGQGMDPGISGFLYGTDEGE